MSALNQKKEKCVVTFRTTAGAMAMEKACLAACVPGRLIPLPRSISAGCGLCWAAPPEARTAVEELVVREHLDVDGIYDILFNR